MIAALLLALAPQAAPTHAVAGWLVDPDGVRLPLVDLELHPLDGQNDGCEVATRCDAQGRWSFADLGSGRWRPALRQFGPDLGAVRFEPAELSVPGPALRLEVEVGHVATGPGLRRAFCVRWPDPEWIGSLEGGEPFRHLESERPWLLLPGSRGFVGTWSRAGGLVEVPFELADAGPWGMRVSPVAPAPSGSVGRVRLRVPRVHTSARVGASILAPGSRHELERFRPEGGDQQSHHFDFELPPGDYLLAVNEREPPAMCALGWHRERYQRRPIELPLHVTSGACIDLDLAWSPGVRPTLAFDAPGAEFVFVWELGPDDRPLRPVRLEPLDPTAYLPADDRWPQGMARATRTPLPVGHVRLVAGAHGYAPHTFELDLVEGASCEARIALPALERR